MKREDYESWVTGGTLCEEVKDFELSRGCETEIDLQIAMRLHLDPRCITTSFEISLNIPQNVFSQGNHTLDLSYLM